jgi:uncharacterized membrane protein YfcA
VLLAELVLAGALIGLLLGVLGAGGAIFTAPLLMFGFDVPPREATTVSLVVVLLAAASGLLGHRGTRNVQWREGALFGAVGSIAAAAGSWLATVLPDRVLTGGFSLLLVVAAVAMVRQPTGSESRRPRRSLLVVTAAALGVGLVTGFFGVGGGFVIVPALVLVLGFGIREATATGLLVISINAAAALAVRGPEYLDWAIALPMAAGAVARSFAGARLAPRMPRELLRQAFAALMVGAAVLLGLQTALA